MSLSYLTIIVTFFYLKWKLRLLKLRGNRYTYVIVVLISDTGNYDIPRNSASSDYDIPRAITLESDYDVPRSNEDIRMSTADNDDDDDDDDDNDDEDKEAPKDVPV